MRFTFEEKLCAVQRELAMRRMLYPRQVMQGKLRRDKAEREIALFESIEADYVRAAARRRIETSATMAGERGARIVAACAFKST